jgi:hypothetical protein
MDGNVEVDEFVVGGKEEGVTGRKSWRKRKRNSYRKEGQRR